MFSTSYIDSWDSFFVMSLFTYFAAIQLLAINPQMTRALRFLPDEELAASHPAVKTDESAVTSEHVADPELAGWAKKLEERLTLHQDYLNPDLKLGELAATIRTNSSVLSRVINVSYGMNFNDFVNGRRCEAFMEAIKAKEHQRHTVLSIALDCGFNSKSTFNRAFKKHAGKSPGEYVKEVD
jgi:AraC-like DNA-binding protein